MYLGPFMDQNGTPSVIIVGMSPSLSKPPTDKSAETDHSQNLKIQQFQSYNMYHINLPNIKNQSQMNQSDVNLKTRDSNENAQSKANHYQFENQSNNQTKNNMTHPMSNFKTNNRSRHQTPILDLDNTIPINNQNVEYKCDACDKKYKYRANLLTHQKIHSNDCLQCKICRKLFARKYNLQKHLQTHSTKDKKPFKCQFCDKTFKHQNILRDHIRCHTGEKPFNCDICWKSFSLKHNLRVHKRRHMKKKS